MIQNNDKYNNNNNNKSETLVYELLGEVIYSLKSSWLLTDMQLLRMCLHIDVSKRTDD